MLNAAKLELDDRREIWQMLKRLGPDGRIRFLKWCCKQVTGPDGLAEVRVTQSTGITHEVFMDIMLLVFAHGLDLGKAATELVRRVRRG